MYLLFIFSKAKKKKTTFLKKDFELFLIRRDKLCGEKEFGTQR
jgi:hypothetical protein